MKKKLILVVTALTLCAAIAVGGTLAYLSSQSNTLVNTFEYSDSSIDPDNPTHIGIELAETTWSPAGAYQWMTKDANDKWAVPADPAASDDVWNSKEYGSQKPMIPTATLNKNPQLRLNTQVAAYVGIGIKLEGMSWAEFDEIAIFKATKGTTVVDNSKSTFDSKWTYHKTSADGKTRYFVYSDMLKPGATIQTNALFEQVKIKNVVETEKLQKFFNDDNKAYKKVVNSDGELVDSTEEVLFNLVITGFGAQAEGDDMPSGWNNLKALSANFNAEFGGTSLGNAAYPGVNYSKINN